MACGHVAEFERKGVEDAIDKGEELASFRISGEVDVELFRDACGRHDDVVR